MTGKQRILSILDGKQPDRMPFYLSCYPEVKKTVTRVHSITEDEIADFYEIDAARVMPYLPGVDLGDGEYSDIFGNISRTVTVNGFTESAVYIGALSEIDDIDGLDKIKWPDGSALDMERCRSSVEGARATGRCVYGGVWASIFTQSRHMVGEEKFLAGLYENPEFIREVVNRVTESYMKINKVYMDAFAEFIDIYYFGSDFATQKSMFISPAMFDNFFAPNMKKIIGQAKGYGKKVMYHCCGNVTPILDRLIEIGVDIIEPVQVSADCMSPDEFAPRYKGRIAFHGGVSSQVTFTTGTPADVYEETTRAIKTLGPYGYVPAPDHELIGTVSAENIGAFVKAVKDYKF